MFHLQGVDGHGRAVVPGAWAAPGLAEALVQLAPKAVAMEACCGAHCWGRRFRDLGLEVIGRRRLRSSWTPRQLHRRPWCRGVELRSHPEPEDRLAHAPVGRREEPAAREKVPHQRRMERSMIGSRHLGSILAAGAVLVAMAGTADAAPTRTNAPTAAMVALAKATLASCGDARLCAYIGQFGAIKRAKGVVAVTNPSAGVYCIAPKPGVFDLRLVVPLVTVEWAASNGNDLLAFYDYLPLSCPAGNIGVRTFDLAGNANPKVAFTLVVE